MNLCISWERKSKFSNMQERGKGFRYVNSRISKERKREIGYILEKKSGFTHIYGTYRREKGESFKFG